MKVERNKRETGEIHQMRGRSYFRDGEGQNHCGKKNSRVRFKSKGKVNVRNVMVVVN